MQKQSVQDRKAEWALGGWGLGGVRDPKIDSFAKSRLILTSLTPEGLASPTHPNARGQGFSKGPQTKKGPQTYPRSMKQAGVAS